MTIEECYRKIYEDCCKDTYRFGKQNYSFQQLSHFVSMKGNKYDQNKVKLMIIGRAPNGWGHYGDAIDGFDFARAAKKDFDTVGFNWVSNDLRSLHNISSTYNLTKSAFWRVGEKVFKELTKCNDYKWVENIAWSNLYKIAPRDGGNPTTKMVNNQLEGCRELLKEEIKEYKPTYILMTVGYSWWFENFKDLFSSVTFLGYNKIGKNKNNIFVEAVGYYDRIPVIVTCRPELRNEESFVNDVLGKISNFNKC